MGLDAYVTCRCWQEGKATPAPIPVQWDAEACVVEPADPHPTRSAWSAYDDWLESACPHENMNAADEWLSNWSGVWEFGAFLHSYEPSVPALHYWWFSREGNSGLVPVSAARVVLHDLETLRRIFGQPDPDSNPDGAWRMEMVRRLRVLFEASQSTGNPVCWA